MCPYLSVVLNARSEICNIDLFAECSCPNLNELIANLQFRSPLHAGALPHGLVVRDDGGCVEGMGARRSDGHGRLVSASKDSGSSLIFFFSFQLLN